MSSNSNIHYCTLLVIPEELAEELIQASLQGDLGNAIRSPAIPLDPAGGIIPPQRLIQPVNRLCFYVNKTWRSGRTIRVRSSLAQVPASMKRSSNMRMSGPNMPTYTSNL